MNIFPTEVVAPRQVAFGKYTAQFYILIGILNGLGGEAHNGADGHDVVDADHVAHAAADGLSGNDDFLGELQLRGHIPLELGEEQVGHGVGAGNEGAEAADVGSEGGPGFTGEGGEGLGEGERHGVHARVVHAGATEDGHQRHGGEQRDGRGLHLGEGDWAFYSSRIKNEYDIENLPGHKDIWKILSVANISKNKNGDSEVTINYHKFSNLTKDFKKREKTKTIVIKRKWDFYNELMDFLVEM